MIVQILELTRKRWVGNQNFVPDNNIMCGDSVLIRNYNPHAFERKYNLDYRVVGYLGKSQLH